VSHVPMTTARGLAVFVRLWQQSSRPEHNAECDGMDAGTSVTSGRPERRQTLGEFLPVTATASRGLIENSRQGMW